DPKPVILSRQVPLAEAQLVPPLATPRGFVSVNVTQLNVVPPVATAQTVAGVLFLMTTSCADPWPSTTAPSAESAPRTSCPFAVGVSAALRMRCPVPGWAPPIASDVWAWMPPVPASLVQPTQKPPLASVRHASVNVELLRGRSRTIILVPN